MASLREKLIEHLTQLDVTITDDGETASGTLVHSSARRVADDVMSIVRAHDEERGKHREDEADSEPWIADTEVAVLARMVGQLDGISDTVPGVTTGTVWRVLHYLADRYGFLIGPTDA